MAAYISQCVQELLGMGLNFPHSVAVSFQVYVLVPVFLLFAMIVAFPVGFSTFIECICPSSNDWRAIIDSKCYSEGLYTESPFSNRIRNHDNYQLVPYFYIQLVLLNVLPILASNFLISRSWRSMVSGMKNYDEEKDIAKANRIIQNLNNSMETTCLVLADMSVSLLSGMLSVHQILFMGRQFHMDLFLYVSNQSPYEIFPHIVNCVASKYGTGGHIEAEEFLCLLNMNRVYNEVLWYTSVLLLFEAFLVCLTILWHVILLIPICRLRVLNLSASNLTNYERKKIISLPMTWSQHLYLLKLRLSIDGGTYQTLLKQLPPPCEDNQES